VRGKPVITRWVPAGGIVILAITLAAAGAPRIGDDRPGYATVATVVTVAFSLTCFLIGGVLALRSPEPVSRFTAVMLVLLGGASPPYTSALERLPGWFVPARLGSAMLMVAIVGFLLVFPTGRVQPTRLRIPAMVWAVAIVAERLTPALDPAGGQSGLLGLLTLAGLGGGLFAQVWRWLRVSDAVARNQTKWVVLGAAVSVAGWVTGALLGDDKASFLVASFASFAIPLSVAVAVLRYRLWDVDVVINRALVFTFLTVLLAGAYLGIVLTTHGLLDGRGDLAVSVGAAALVAVAFQPLRVAIQRLVNRLMYGERDDPYAVLTRLGAVLEQGAGTGGALSHIVGTVASALRLPGAAITLREPGGEVLVANHGVLPDDAVRLPLTHQGVAIGELLLASRGPRDPLSPADIRLLEDLSRHIAVAALATQLTGALQSSRERLVTARAEERRRLRRELHDGLAPQLVALAMRLEAARARVGDQEVKAILEDLADRARATIGEIRRLVNALRPPVLDELGFVSAVRETALGHAGNGAGPMVLFEASPEIPELPAAVETAAYRIAQEALTNVVRHADARNCLVQLTFDSSTGELSLEVTDDGRGIAPDAPAGVGILSMRERAEELGGDLVITPSTVGGTRLRACLPCRSRAEAAAS
jgi:signal transduction histidine kinase